ncbi:cupin domain-containing protein [Caminicella sporogenes]|uniref:cupin domain-containing protein n=1 Tax=Caminicella sporogenes TaxID=166485 RepID=UPI0025418E02|nr:cupin domain-containing protein [Caminicella sporogenes]WIF95711.1 cupin domain-containing protein [Caminicella sporogenes]
MQKKFLKNIPFEKVLELKNLVDYAERRVSSKTLVQRGDLSITLFAFDKGEGLSTHSAPGDAMVYVIEGSVRITIGQDTKVVLKEGQTVVMPANIPHALESIEKFKMMLIVVKPQN